MSNMQPTNKQIDQWIAQVNQEMADDEFPSLYKRQVKLASLVLQAATSSQTGAMAQISGTQPEKITEPIEPCPPSEHATRVLNNPPEQIYLQVGDIESDFPGEINWRDVTWSEDKIERSDLVYIKQEACALAVEELVSCVEQILSNDGGEDSQRFSALRLHEARERTKNAIKRIKVLIGENRAKDST